MNAQVATNPDRAVASLVGAAVGDALGWPQEPRGGLVGGSRARSSRPARPEFTGWQRSAGSRFLRYQEEVEPGAYSDDTQLMLAVARSCLRGDGWLTHLTRVELPAWPVYQRGGGRAVLSAAGAWAAGSPPWAFRRGKTSSSVDAYFGAGANGAAMRIAPHALVTSDDKEPRSLHERVVRDAVSTHGHPRAIIGALCLAATISTALRSREPLLQGELIDAAMSGLAPLSAVSAYLPAAWGDSSRRSWFDSTWDATLDEAKDLLGVARRSLNRGSMSNVSDTLRELGAVGKFSGSGTNSVVAAIYLASRSGTRPVSGLLQAAFEPDLDTDTVASMTGAVLGAIHGMHWLESMRDVQDMAYIADLAVRLTTQASGGGFLEEPLAPPSSPRAFYKQIDAGGLVGRFVDGREYRVQDRELLAQDPWVLRFRLELSDGQTLVVDRVTRTSPDGESLLSSGGTEDRDAVASVVLPTRDIETTRRFYERLVGRSLRVKDGTLHLNERLGFIEVGGHRNSWVPDAQVTVSLADLKSVLLIMPSARARPDGTATVNDPDGRLVILTERLRDGPAGK